MNSLVTTTGGDQPTLDLSEAPLPNAKTLRQRMSIPLQFMRFLAFNALIRV